MSDRVITARVPAQLAKKVDQLANSLDRTRNSIVTAALSSWVAREGERLQWTLDALADVDAGRTVDHEAVCTWAKSLTGL
jgi:predicted transcriptional regulator